MVSGYDRSSICECIDRSCDLLGSASRRQVIYALQKHGSSTVEELADAIVSAGISDVRKQVLTSLIHTHLPKLSDADVVEYSGPQDEVTLSDGVAALEPFLAITAQQETDSERVQPDGWTAGGAVTTGPE